MKNSLGKFLAVGSLVAGGSCLALAPAYAFSIGDQLQLNASAVFYDSDGIPGGPNSLAVMFRKSTANDAIGGPADYATNGAYGNFDNIVNGGTTGYFNSYEGTPLAGLEILSLTLPSRTPVSSGGINTYVDPSIPSTHVLGSTIFPSANFPGGSPFLKLTNGLVANTPVNFFIDKITEFRDNIPSSSITKSFNISANGTWKDAAGSAVGQATINGTFSVQPSGSILVDILTGDVCGAIGGSCIPTIASSFGGTFVVTERSVPESSPVSALIGFGLVGSAFALRRKAKLN